MSEPTPTPPHTQTSLPPTPTATAFPESDLSLRVDAQTLIENGDIVRPYIGIQGSPVDMQNDYEAQLWKNLGLRADTFVSLFNDKDGPYWGGMLVQRAADAPAPWIRVRGDLNLWLDPTDFDAYTRQISERLGIDPRELIIGIGYMPRDLAYIPPCKTGGGACEPPGYDWSYRSPRDLEEWKAVVTKAAELLRARGYGEPRATPPRFILFHEAENSFLGYRENVQDWGRLEDYAALYVTTQESMQSVLGDAVIYASGMSVYSVEWLDKLQGFKNPLAIERIMKEIKRSYPDAKISGLAYQVYRFGGDDLLFGKGGIGYGGQYLRQQLAYYGFDPNIPISILGWSGSVYNSDVDGPRSEVVEPIPGETPEQYELRQKERIRDLVDQESGFLAYNLIDLANPGGEKAVNEATYYTWQLDGNDVEKCLSNFLHPSIVSTKNSGFLVAEGCFTPPSELECPRAGYVVFEQFRRFSEKVFVGSDIVEDKPLFRLAAAIDDKGQAQIMVAHRDGAGIPSARLEVAGLQPATTYEVRASHVESQLDLCASLAAHQTEQATTDDQGVLQVFLPAIPQPVLFVELTRQ